MSFRAKLLSAAMRVAAKGAQERSDQNGVVELRASLERTTAASPRPPRSARFEPVDAGGRPAEWVSVPSSRSDRIVLYLHGGSYIAGSPRTHRNLTFRVAEAARARVLVLDYRLAPEHPYPAGVEDVLQAYAWLLQSHPASRIAWCGDSAGGGLLFSALRAAHPKLPLPCAAVALSPWADLAGKGASWHENAKRDPWLSPGSLRRASVMYRGELAPTDPGPSSVYATFEAGPPTLIHVGESELLRDDSYGVAERMRAAGIPVEVRLYRDVPHVWHMFAPLLPESNEALAEIGSFLSRHFGI